MQKKNMSVRLDESEFQEVKKICEAKDISTSQFFREAMLEHAKEVYLAAQNFIQGVESGKIKFETQEQAEPYVKERKRDLRIYEGLFARAVEEQEEQEVG